MDIDSADMLELEKELENVFDEEASLLQLRRQLVSMQIFRMEQERKDSIISSLKGRLDSIQYEQTVYGKEREELLHRISDLEASQTDYNELNAHLVETIDKREALSEDLALSQMKLEEQTTRADLLDQESQFQSNHISTFQHQLLANQKELDALNEKNFQLAKKNLEDFKANQNELNQIKLANTALEEQIDIMQRDLDKMTAALEESGAEKLAFQQSLEHAEELRNIMNSDMEEQQDELANREKLVLNLESQVKGLTEANNKLISSHKEAQVEWNSSLEKAEKQASTKTNEVQIFKTSLTDLSREIVKALQQAQQRTANTENFRGSSMASVLDYFTVDQLPPEFQLILKVFSTIVEENASLISDNKTFGSLNEKNAKTISELEGKLSVCATELNTLDGLLHGLAVYQLNELNTLLESSAFFRRHSAISVALSATVANLEDYATFEHGILDKRSQSQGTQAHLQKDGVSSLDMSHNKDHGIIALLQKGVHKMSNAAKEYLLEISRLCESTECAVEKSALWQNHCSNDALMYDTDLKAAGRKHALELDEMHKKYHDALVDLERNSAEAEAAVQAVADEAQAEMLLLGEKYEDALQLAMRQQKQQYLDEISEMTATNDKNMSDILYLLLVCVRGLVDDDVKMRNLRSQKSIIVMLNQRIQGKYLKSMDSTAFLSNWMDGLATSDIDQSVQSVLGSTRYAPHSNRQDTSRLGVAPAPTLVDALLNMHPINGTATTRVSTHTHTGGRRRSALRGKKLFRVAVICVLSYIRLISCGKSCSQQRMKIANSMASFAAVQRQTQKVLIPPSTSVGALLTLIHNKMGALSCVQSDDAPMRILDQLISGHHTARSQEYYTCTRPPSSSLFELIATPAQAAGFPSAPLGEKGSSVDSYLANIQNIITAVFHENNRLKDLVADKGGHWVEQDRALQQAAIALQRQKEELVAMQKERVKQDGIIVNVLHRLSKEKAQRLSGSGVSSIRTNVPDSPGIKTPSNKPSRSMDGSRGMASRSMDSSRGVDLSLQSHYGANIEESFLNSSK